MVAYMYNVGLHRLHLYTEHNTLANMSRKPTLDTVSYSLLSKVPRQSGSAHAILRNDC